MKQNYPWFGIYYKKFLTTFTLVFMVSAMFAQTLTNGNLGTGATSLNGTAASAGTTWHELQNATGNTTESNSLLGVSHTSQGTTNNTLADDFIVPGGNTWTINTLTVHSLDQVVPPTGTTSPYNNIRVRIWNGVPGVAGSTIVFGDLTTNRFASTTFSGRKGIFNSQVPTPAAPTPNLPIFSITANLGTTVVLTAGTYWVEWQIVHTANCFSPTSQTVGIRTMPAYNARQSVAAVWAALIDGGNPATAPDVAVDLPFTITYTAAPTTPCTGTPAPGNTVSTTSAACPGTPFTLSLQNAIPGTGVTYQWQQSTTGVGGPYSNIAGANGPTYSVASITATTFYQAIATCSGNNGTSTPVGVNSITCYCASGATNTADEEIFNVSFGTLNNTSTCATLAPGVGSILNRYSNYTGYAGAPVATVLRGLISPLSVQIGTCGGNFTNSVAVWIDYNQDGTFAATEKVYVSAAGTAGPHTETANILIPVTATPGTTRMRVVNVETGAPAGIAACGTYTWGETEDYTVNIVVPTPCTGTPAPGNTLSTQSSVCSGTTGYTLSLQNNPPVSGLTYQWFSGATPTGTFTAIAGATGPTYTVASITVATCYYAAVTCSGVTTNSTPVCVAINPPNQCYCASGATSAADEEILRVTVGTLNNSSTCATLAPGPGSILNRYSNYTNYTGAPAAPSLTQGTSVPFTVGIGTCGGNFTNSTAIFIDLNADGDFIDPGERVYVGAAGVAGPHNETGNLVIPATATLGVTRMRVINVETGAPLGITPCGTYTWGETEDYNVNITPCIPLTVTAQPTSVSAVCGASTSFTLTTTGTSPVYQWQYRTSATGTWLIVPPAAPYSGTTTGTLTINPVGTTMNGYQYRAVFSGGCTATDFSSITTLTVTPIVATVTPTSAAFCLGGTQQLTITNIASPVPGTATFSSGVLSLPIADGAIAGVNHTIPVSGIPAGATVTNVTVTVNVPHTYVSDLMLVVRGPNNQILNLSNLIGGGNNPGANFTNTAFSSLATAPLNTGTAPGYTGIFKPDAAGAVGAFGVPGGPTGFTPTLPGGSLSAFHALVNGNWTIAMYDAGPPDVGTLTGWSVKIDYLLGSPATGVFTGPAGTIFTNAGATAAYTGTPINTVYVKPLAGGLNNYSVVVTDGACSSNPLTIPVTVNQAVGGTATVLPASTTICQGNNTTFTLGGTLTGPSAFIHQYQVSTNGGLTYTNITNGGVYSGATTSSLTLTNVPTSFNGYRFRDSISAAGNCGSLISSVATLSVNPKPVVTISAAPITKLFPGLTSTLTAAVSSATAPISYQWLRNGAAVTGATTNTRVVTIDALGAYTVNVTDANGCTSAGVSIPSSIAISDSATSDRLFIYPSPNSGQFQVRYFTNLSDGSRVPGAVNIYDEKGARVFTRAYSVGAGYQPMIVDLGPTHAKGIYRVDVVDTKGDRLKTGSVAVF
jgi:GEVED domain/Ig-like domain CHU_C associated